MKKKWLRGGKKWGKNVVKIPIFKLLIFLKTKQNKNKKQKKSKKKTRKNRKAHTNFKRSCSSNCYVPASKGKWCFTNILVIVKYNYHPLQ